jgi:serine/threonine protein phosphatase PrpC
MGRLKTEYIYEKGTGCINEDALSINNTTFGVFDGATSLDKKVYENGLTGGFLASSTACRIFQNDSCSLSELAEKANTEIQIQMQKRDVDLSDKSSLWSTSAAAVRIKNNCAEWIQIGDSLVLMIYKDGSFKIPAPFVNHDKETLSMWKDMALETEKPIHKALYPQIKKVRSSMNSKYGVLNGESKYSAFLNSGKEDLNNLSHILLFTDGLFIPSDDPEKNDFDEFTKLYLNGGLTNIKKHIRKLEESDPDCRIYPRFKCHDDIAAVGVSL